MVDKRFIWASKWNCVILACLISCIFKIKSKTNWRILAKKSYQNQIRKIISTKCCSSGNVINMWVLNIPITVELPEDLRACQHCLNSYLKCFLFCNKQHSFISKLPTNTPRVFHAETTWKRPFPRCFNVE